MCVVLRLPAGADKNPYVSCGRQDAVQGTTGFSLLPSILFKQSGGGWHKSHANVDSLAGAHLLGHRSMDSHQCSTQDFPE
mgnify:CR=1 FL=1